MYGLVTAWKLITTRVLPLMRTTRQGQRPSCILGLVLIVGGLLDGKTAQPSRQPIAVPSPTKPRDRAIVPAGNAPELLVVAALRAGAPLPGHVHRLRARPTGGAEREPGVP
ncbi:hypothetical protein AB0425_19155 [Actinosynnema sp. NPDC051121]